MTALHRPVRRLLDVYERGRPLVVKMTRAGIYIRRQCERETGPGCYFLPWQSVYGQAARLRAAEIRREREAKRKRARELFKELNGRELRAVQP